MILAEPLPLAARVRRRAGHGAPRAVLPLGSGASGTCAPELPPRVTDCRDGAA